MTETNSSQLVRVGIPDVKVQKCIVLNAMDTVWTAKQVILHKVYRELTLDPLNYGIYLPGTAKGNLGKFLIDSQLLSDYALEGIIPKLELRYKRRDYSLTLLTDKAISKVDNRHDTTVAAMTIALQVFNNKQPGYASAFAVELYSNANKIFLVKMFRRDGPNSENFELLNVTYCKDSGMCTLEEFESFVTPLIPDDLALECGNTPTTQSPDMKKQQSLKVIAITLGCILCVALAIITIIAVVSLASNLRKRRRSHLPTESSLLLFKKHDS